MAVTDHLTGVANRLGFDLELQKIEQEMKKNPDLGVYLFLIDLDRFKEVNDEYGMTPATRCCVISRNYYAGLYARQTLSGASA
jgi:diguanylate cyclase (GGDEF)-like protein